MALMAAHGEIKPMPKCAIFADTQREPESVYKWLSWMCGVEVKYRIKDGIKEAYVDPGYYINGTLPYTVVIVTKGNLADHVTKTYFSKRNQKRTLYSLPAYTKNPDGSQGHMTRQCTSDFKVGPIDKEITFQMRKHGVRKCIKWIGISLDEIHRIKPSRRNNCEHIWPLVDNRMRRHDCVIWMKSHGYQEPPKSACDMCPYHSDNEWLRLKRMEPASFEKAVLFEKEYQAAAAAAAPNMMGTPFLHRSLVPLDQVDFSTDEDHGQQVMFGNECEGMCGV